MKVGGHVNIFFWQNSAASTVAASRISFVTMKSQCISSLMSVVGTTSRNTV